MANRISLLTPNYKGVLQSNGYEAYAAMRAHDQVVWVVYWAHCRRYFFQAQTEAPPRIGLRLIAHLYRYERQWDEAEPRGAKLRAALRRAIFSLTLALSKKRCSACSSRFMARSLVGQGCTYVLNQWEPLIAHLYHGQTNFDTNAIENAIRPSAVRKKN